MRLYDEKEIEELLPFPGFRPMKVRLASAYGRGDSAWIAFTRLEGVEFFTMDRVSPKDLERGIPEVAGVFEASLRGLGILPREQYEAIGEKIAARAAFVRISCLDEQVFNAGAVREERKYWTRLRGYAEVEEGVVLENP